MKSSKKGVGKSLLIGALLSAAFWKVMKAINKDIERKKATRLSRYKAELSTYDLCREAAESEQRLHSEVLELAQQKGVSTKGSDIDIMGRVLHKDTIEFAQQNGVSTEGSDRQILERTIHKKTAEKAQRLGLSTEGTTEEIKKRIRTQKPVVKEKPKELANVPLRDIPDETLKKIAEDIAKSLNTDAEGVYNSMLEGKKLDRERFEKAEKRKAKKRNT